jgi:hypothetical protein
MVNYENLSLRMMFLLIPPSPLKGEGKVADTP